MTDEIFRLLLSTVHSIWWGRTQKCEDSDKTFDKVKLGNMLRSRKYRLIDEKLISSKCFSDDDCLLDQQQECNIYNFLGKGNDSLNLSAYIENVNDTIFRIVNYYNNIRVAGTEYKIFSPQNTPLLYEHKCFTDESMKIKHVHKVVLQGHDVSMRTPKTGECGIFLIEYMPDELKKIVQEVIPDLVNKTTANIIDVLSTNVTENTNLANTSLNYTNNYGIIDYNSTAINSYDEHRQNDNPDLLFNGLILATATTFTASMTYLLNRMYNKYCKKAPIVPGTNISDPNLVEINGKKAMIYYSDISADGHQEAIVDISINKAKYTNRTYDTSKPSTSHSDTPERVELMSLTGDSTQDNVNLGAYRASSSVHNDDCVPMFCQKVTFDDSTLLGSESVHTDSP